MSSPIEPVVRRTLSALAVTAALLASYATSALAQPSPEPPECTCSPGINIGTQANPVIIRHCQCGIMSCVVVVSSGQLQCSR
jgi:hypothetical protein